VVKTKAQAYVAAAVKDDRRPVFAVWKGIRPAHHDFVVLPEKGEGIGHCELLAAKPESSFLVPRFEWCEQEESEPGSEMLLGEEEIKPPQQAASDDIQPGTHERQR
jgi:hypothetical protein